MILSWLKRSQVSGGLVPVFRKPFCLAHSQDINATTGRRGTCFAKDRFQ